nr:immunoglobulin heavy chain junction region [Mus musculus]
ILLCSNRRGYGSSYG